MMEWMGDDEDEGESRAKRNQTRRISPFNRPQNVKKPSVRLLAFCVVKEAHGGTRSWNIKGSGQRIGNFKCSAFCDFPIEVLIIVG